MTSSRPTAAPTLLIVVCTLVVTACPLPIARTEASSAPLVGGVVWADGGPAAELDVAVSTGWDDGSCTAPAGVRGSGRI